MLFRQLQRYSKSSAFRFVSLLFIADLGFIVLHMFYALTNFGYNPLFSIVNDSGYAEFYQYLKWFWIIVLFVYIAVSRRSFSYLIWGIIFLYILCDDAFQIHELAGTSVATRLAITPPFGVIPQDFGEIIVSAIAAAVILFLLLLFYIKGSKIFRKISRDIIALIFILGFCGVVVDVIHTPFVNIWILNFIFVLLEDGGEMFIASLILGYVFLRSSQSDEDEATYLGDLVRGSIDRYRNLRKEA